MSGSGYSVSYLKGTLGQAKAYIRPIQKDLSLEVSNAIKVRTCHVFHFCHVLQFHFRGSLKGGQKGEGKKEGMLLYKNHTL